ncbi:MAG: hypothetical protein GY751_21305 [Bacteroidetes bacterium]|nr:hypothetical protein [Bacteroidota bacterium]
MKLAFTFLLMFASLQGIAQSAQAHYDAAMDKLNEGAVVKEVFESLNQCTELDSSFEDAYYLKAFVYYRLNDFEAAVHEYDALLKVSPYNREALKRRALAKIQLYDLDGAIEDHNRRLVLEPLDAVIYFDRAYCKGLQNDVIGSIHDYSKALELDPYFKEAYVNRGAAKMHLIASGQEIPKFITRESVCKDISTAKNLGDRTATKIHTEYCSGDNQ